MEPRDQIVFARCCDEAEKHQAPFLAYRIDLDKVPIINIEEMPKWVVGVRPFSDRERHWGIRTVRYCPFCGKKLPDPWPRKEKPKNIHEPQDGDYCGTCTKRVRECECFPLEWHWQWPNIPRYVLSNMEMQEELRLNRHMVEDDLEKLYEHEKALKIAMTALHQIAEFGHVGGPHCCRNAPVYECGCFDKSQWDIAKEAIARIDREPEEEEEPHYIVLKGSQCERGPEYKHDEPGRKCAGCNGVITDTGKKDEEPKDDSVRIGSEGVAAEVGFLSDNVEYRVREDRLLEGLVSHYGVSLNRAREALEVALEEGAVRRFDGWIEAVTSKG